jgi:hypothetical protein
MNGLEQVVKKGHGSLRNMKFLLKIVFIFGILSEPRPHHDRSNL